MSISALTTEASRLIRVFQDKEEDIDAAVAAAVAAAGDMKLFLYIDSIGGDDDNPGTAALPLKTLEKANTLVKDGMAVQITFACDGSYAFAAATSVGNCDITWIGNWVPSYRTVTTVDENGLPVFATITQGASALPGTTYDVTGRYDGNGTSLWVYQCHLKTATKTASGQTFPPYRSGFVTAPGSAVVQAISNSTLELHDAPAANAYNFGIFSFTLTDVNLVGDGPLVQTETGVCLLHVYGVTVTPTTLIKDLVVGYTSSPKNFVSNVSLD